MRRMGIGLGVGINRSNYAQGIFGAYQSRVVADGGVTEAGACVDAVSGLLQTASLLLIPSGYKSGKAYAEIPTNGNGDLTWTRTSTAIRTNSSSLLESMATGVPRLSYMYGSCPSALLEPQRTNLALYSDDFSNGWWAKNTGVSVTANTTTSPDGSVNADTLDEGTAIGTHRLLGAGVGITAGATYTISVYAKKNTMRYIRLVLNDLTDTAKWLCGQYDLDNGTITTGVGLTAGSTIAGSSMTSVGNGWYRCTLTGSMTITTSIYPIIYGSDGSSILSTDGRGGAGYGGTSKQVYLYGAQLEAGAYPTTYIPTTSATATRVADSFSRSNIYTNGLISASGGTWFVELRNNVAYTRDSASGLEIANSGFTQRIILFNAGGNSRLIVFLTTAGTVYTTTTDTVKLAIKWNGSTASVFANGTKVANNVTFTGLNMENLIGGQGVPFFIQQMALFPSPLSDTDCTTLTT